MHPNLVDSAAQVCKATDMFGGAVEKVLIKHGKVNIFYYNFMLCFSNLLSVLVISLCRRYVQFDFNQIFTASVE